MTSSLNDIRRTFLDYFVGQSHEEVASSPLVPHNDPTLMFTNAGMVQFKDVFSGKESWPQPRATSSQKCVRAGGKHNDLDNVGYTARHHTFFEMLGNFSFGDYFKEGAIEYAWEFLTKTLELPEEKLFFTVYHTDDEAFDLWKKIAGVPEEKILRVPTKDNFWQMGDTGPCGPCSEIFYDHGEGITGEWALDKDGHDLFDERYVEIWNLVFMQFEKLDSGEQIDLPKPSIDTGFGLERVAAAMQGKHSNYEIDLFEHLIAASKDASGNNDAVHEASHRVIADHLRSTSFLMADGVMPSNEGRGYVLRRIMRRGMRHAHLLGCKEPLLYRLVPALIAEMGEAYPELGRAEALITEMLKTEEERFKETLGNGLKLLEEASTNLTSGDKLDGAVAFKLYDTYGFPLDLTQDVLRAQEIDVDIAGFDSAMEEQKAKARAAWAGSGEKATDTVWLDIREESGATEFLGYKTLKATGTIVALVKDGERVESASTGDEVMIVTNQTPFYGESGGQAGDHGVIRVGDEAVTIIDTLKQAGEVHVHIGKTDGPVKVGNTAELEVDEARREKLRANHSATHLLHAVLRKFLGDHVTQKGSLVEADYFRFDFSHPKGVSEEEIAKIEEEVNRLVQQNSNVTTKLMSPDEAISHGAMALFGEKYSDEVRVLSMGKDDDTPYSVELCGGTHVSSTGEIEQFKITRESSVAAGIRRIEAVTKEKVSEIEQAKNQEQKEQEARKQAAEAEKAEASASASQKREEFNRSIDNVESIGEIKFLGLAIDNLPAKELRTLVDDFKHKVDNGIVALIAINEGKASLSVGVTENLSDQFNAVDLVRIGAEIVGGKGGGGRPDMAQAGGPDGSKAEDAISAIKSHIAT